MTLNEPLWRFTDSVSDKRRQQLLSVANFDKVIHNLLAGTIVLYDAKFRNDCGRVIFHLAVTEETYDAFFNSPNGYRAQYCIGASYGDAQNRSLINALTDTCLMYSLDRPRSNFSQAQVIASLSGLRAKVWVPESDIPTIDDVHINYPPWVEKAKRVYMGTMSDEASRAYAVTGVLAPVGTHLEIKGAWVFADGTEWLDPKKKHRAEEIRDYGYT